MNEARRIADHPLLGTERVYHPDLPPYDATTDSTPGTLVIGNGQTVTVLEAFHTWNGCPGLDMLYVHNPSTGRNTHVTPSDLGWHQPLRPFRVGDQIVTTVFGIGGRSAEVVGTVTEVVMSRRFPGRVATYTTQTEMHGLLSVEAAKARPTA